MVTPSVEIDEELREAAVRGDVEFLRKCVASKKPNQYYLTVFPKRNSEDDLYGNIFHIAACVQEEEFIRTVIDDKLLDVEVIQRLLCQPASEDTTHNPLHLAASVGNVEIVKMFQNAFNSSLSDLPTPPWLLTDDEGDTPCHWALQCCKEECGLEILKMDKEALSNMVNHREQSLLFLAVRNGLKKVAMEILRSSKHSFSASGPDSLNALHVVPNCSSEGGNDICRLLLDKKLEIITQKDSGGQSIFHWWAIFGEIWPFECFLNSTDIIPNARKVLVDLISTTNNQGKNPLHILSNFKGMPSMEYVKIGKLLIDTYRQQIEAHASSSISTKLQFPWLVKDDGGRTPLDLAIANRLEEFAKMILLEDKNALETCAKNILFMAIENRFDKVPQKILEIVDERGLSHLLTNQEKLNALHLAPKCNKEFFELLLKGHPELIETLDRSGNTILHTWAKIGQVWPFEYLLKRKNIDPNVRSRLRYRLDLKDNRDGNTPFHVAASCTNAAAHQILKLLVEAFQEDIPWWMHLDKRLLPWLMKNYYGEGALHLAIRCQQDQKIVLHLLSIHQDEPVEELLDCYATMEHKILFLAIEKNFSKVVKKIFTRLNKASWTKYLKDSSNCQNVLHLASICTDNELGRWLVENAPEFITQPDTSNITPLDQASDIGAAWIIKKMLQKGPSAFGKAPPAWVKACEKGHVSVIRVFVEYCPGKLSDHCIHHQDSPLHHIKLQNLTGYEEFLKIRHMKDLINLQDSEGATPLHKAIRNRNILLAEVLLNMDNIRYNINDNEDKTARGLLEKLCKEDQRWDQMCKSIGFDPSLKTSYFQRKTDLLEVRNTLSVVAALLATITFTAGFTLPGGLNQDNGEAMLADKAAFVVFLISDTLAMCFSMSVLICLIWSMVFEPNKSLFLIDRSVGLIKVALYLTLLAFVTGVYIVISPKSLWAAILIIVMCSLVGISANMTLMYKFFTLLDNIFSSANMECGNPIRLMEMGILSLSNRGENSNQDRSSVNQSNEDLQLLENGCE